MPLRVCCSLSIKTKLAFFFTLAAFAMFYCTALFIHQTLHTSLSKEENDFIYDRLHTLRAIIQENPNYLEIIRKSIEWEGEYSPYPEYYLRIMDSSGETLIETPGMEKTIPASWVSAPATRERDATKDVTKRADNGRYFLLKSDAMQSPHSKFNNLTLQIALDVTSEVTIDDANHDKIKVIVVVGVILFVTAGVLIIALVLSPLEQMVNVAEGVSLNNISERAQPEACSKEVRRVAVSFNKMLDRLEGSVTRLSQYASNMAHEIRTPISIVMGEVEVTLMKERTPAEYKIVLESVMEECGRLSRLVDNVLFLAHAENPTAAVQRIVFDPLREIEDIYTFFAPWAEEKDAQLNCYGTAVLYADPLLFRRVMSNLVANALFYSERGVKVDIEVGDSDEQYQDVTVRDTGFGIPEEMIPRLFDRFYRGDASHSNYAAGSGLGLSIVKAIMALHGGTIHVASKFGSWTSFTLRFPKQSSEQGPKVKATKVTGLIAENDRKGADHDRPYHRR